MDKSTIRQKISMTLLLEINSWCNNNLDNLWLIDWLYDRSETPDIPKYDESDLYAVDICEIVNDHVSIDAYSESITVSDNGVEIEVYDMETKEHDSIFFEKAFFVNCINDFIQLFVVKYEDDRFINFENRDDDIDYDDYDYDNLIDEDED